MKTLRNPTPRHFPVLASLLLLLLGTQTLASQYSTAITGLEVVPERNEIRLLTQGAVEYGYFPLSQPPRLVFDFPGTTVMANGAESLTEEVEGACFHKVSLATFSVDPPIARLVIYLDQPAAAAVNYAPDEGVITIRCSAEPQNGNASQTSDAGSLVVPEASSGCLLSGPSSARVDYEISSTPGGVSVRFTGIDPGNIRAEMLDFPPRLHIRMFGKGPVGDIRPRFDPLERGNIWNAVAKNWVSFIDRDGLGIIDITIYLYPGVTFSQSIMSDGRPEITLHDSAAGRRPDESQTIFPEVEVAAFRQETPTEQTGPRNLLGPEIETAGFDFAPAEQSSGNMVDAVAEPEGVLIANGQVIIESREEPRNLSEAGQKPDSGIPEVPMTVQSGDLLSRTAVEEQGPIYMWVGEVRVLPVQQLVRASVGNPAVATLNVVSQSELLVTALASGSTTLVIWQEDGGHRTMELHVFDSTVAKEREISNLINDENVNVRVVMAGDSPGVVLEGVVESEEEKTRAESIAALFAGEGRVSNLIEVSNPRQVMVKVRMVEISRRALDQRLSQMAAGVRTDTDDFTFNVITDLLDPENPGGGLFDTRVRPGIVNGEADDLVFDPIDAFLNELESNRQANILSEPNLIAMSNHPAHFRVGGEVPYTYLNESGISVVDFKEFGIQLDVTPNVDSQGNIRLKVAPTVRTVDMALAISGIPGFRTREVQTEVQLRPGETLVIGGLIEHEITEVVSRIPLLADIPVLGELFQSRRFNDDETELVVFLTPYIIEEAGTAATVVNIPSAMERSD